MTDLAQKKELLRLFLPNFIYAKKEQYKSCFFSSYDFICEVDDENDLTLTIDPSKNAIKYGFDTEFQLICNIVEHHDENDNIVTDLIYYVFFPYNGKIGIVNKGEHWIDIEHVVLRFGCQLTALKLETLKQPTFVYFSHHSTGTWRQYIDCDIDCSNRVIVYMAKGSHAMYWSQGTYYRYFGFANDKCSLGKRVEYKHTHMMVYDKTNIQHVFNVIKFHQDSYINLKNKETLYIGCKAKYNFTCNITCFN